jgi:tripartite-type tricarboxylate transporter receptor subunit TctC
MHPRRSLIVKASLLALSTLFAPLVPAQTGPIKIVVGYPAGATSDALARVVGEAMARRLNQPVVIENKTGAGGQIANQMVKMAPADGHTLLMTPVATMSIFPHSFAGRLQYDPFKDFAPVAHLSNFQVGLGVGTGVPARTLAEYVAWVKANPEKNGFYGSAAPGSLPHFFGVMFAKTAGIQLQHVAYRGTAGAMQALAGGEIAALSTVAADLQSLVQANKATLLAVAGEKRSPQFPKVPTFREQGYDLVATPWYGLFAPAGTPSATVQRLAQAAMEAVQDPAVAQRLADMGVEPTGYAPAKLAEIMKADYERWGAPIRESGFKPGE